MCECVRLWVCNTFDCESVRLWGPPSSVNVWYFVSVRMWGWTHLIPYHNMLCQSLQWPLYAGWTLHITLHCSLHQRVSICYLTVPWAVFEVQLSFPKHVNSTFLNLASNVRKPLVLMIVYLIILHQTTDRSEYQSAKLLEPGKKKVTDLNFYTLHC